MYLKEMGVDWTDLTQAYDPVPGSCEHGNSSHHVLYEGQNECLSFTLNIHQYALFL